MNNLPNEILDQIFSHLPTPSLLQFRLVNHRFKDLITPICRQRYPTIHFKWKSETAKFKTLDSFYDTFKNPLDLPWSGIALETFDIGGSAGLQWLKRDEIQKLTGIFGPQVKKLEIIGYSIPGLVNILNGCPNLRVLKLSEVGKMFIKSHCDKLLKLKTLEILDITFTTYHYEFLEFLLCEIVAGLREIRIEFTDGPDQSQHKMVSILAAIPNIYITFTPFGTCNMRTACQMFVANGLNIKGFEFRIPAICHEGPCQQNCKPPGKVYDLLCYNSQNLVELTIEDTQSNPNFWCKNGFEFPALHNLKYLKLISITYHFKNQEFNQEEAEEKSESSFKNMKKFRNDQLPKLRVIEMEGIDIEKNPFQSGQFENVMELIVKDEKGEQIQWHLIFPNLRRFTGNVFNKEKVCYMASNFKKLMHLKLGVGPKNCGMSVNLKYLPVSDYIVDTTLYGVIAFNLSLSHLILDFRGCSDIKESSLFYKNFIVNIPPLQYLGLFHTRMSETFRQAIRSNHQTFEQC